MAECVTVPAASAPEGAVSVPLADTCCDLLQLFGGVSDGRSDQGRDHPVAAVLALSAAATVAGMRGYTAIAGWVADVPAGVLADVYMRAGAAPAGPPSKTTIWRVCTDADGEAFDAAIGHWADPSDDPAVSSELVEEAADRRVWEGRLESEPPDG